jgi:hypothetical protein
MFVQNWFEQLRGVLVVSTVVLMVSPQVFFLLDEVEDVVLGTVRGFLMLLH